MSWNKNTNDLSDLDLLEEACKVKKWSFTIKKIGKVQAMGLNDSFQGKNFYILRKITINKKGKKEQYREQMIRLPDCDADDYIVLVKTSKNIPLEKTLKIKGD
jgi:hypothetical protein